MKKRVLDIIEYLVTIDINKFSFDESIEDIFLHLKYSNGRQPDSTDDEIRRKIQESRDMINMTGSQKSSNYLDTSNLSTHLDTSSSSTNSSARTSFETPKVNAKFIV